jgi:hypothetical protein
LVIDLAGCSVMSLLHEKWIIFGQIQHIPFDIVDYIRKLIIKIDDISTIIALLFIDKITETSRYRFKFIRQPPNPGEMYDLEEVIIVRYPVLNTIYMNFKHIADVHDFRHRTSYLELAFGLVKSKILNMAKLNNIISKLC